MNINANSIQQINQMGTLKNGNGRPITPVINSMGVSPGASMARNKSKQGILKKAPTYQPVAQQSPTIKSNGMVKSELRE